MDIDLFATSPAGRLIPISGYDQFLRRNYKHFAFAPHPLAASIPLAERTYQLISEADRAIGRLDAAVDRLPNPSLLTRPALRREAVSTSALEGTYTTLLEVFEADYIEERRRSSQVREVLNYVAAAERGLELIKRKPVCVTLISELQALLVRGTPSEGASAGRLRDGQVFIGERERGIERARFVPSPPGDLFRDGVSDWEKWLNAEDDIPLLVKAAIGHYQFETLHPFQDGNGRLGRLIVALQLVQAEALHYPVLILSPWLKDREDTYKDLMLQSSATGEFDPWVQFFAEAVRAQARDATRRIEQLVDVRAAMVRALRQERARGVVLDIVEDLIGYPVITPSQAAELHNVTYPPANSAIQRLVQFGFLREMTGRTYGRVYGCTEIMRIVESPSLDE